MSLSVESALESFDFLEQDAADEAESTPRSTASGGSECHDTGYNSTDDYTKDLVGEGASDVSYIVDFLMSDKTMEDIADSSGKDKLSKIEEDASCDEQSEGEINQCEETNHENADINSCNDAPSCITDIFSSSSSTPNLGQRSASFDATESKEEATNGIPSNTSSPWKRIEATDLLSEESPQHSSYKTRSSRAASPNLSSSYGPEATVGNKVLDKVKWNTNFVPERCSCLKLLHELLPCGVSLHNYRRTVPYSAYTRSVHKVVYGKYQDVHDV